MNKQKFMRTEFGVAMERTIKRWDAALNVPKKDSKPEILRELAWCQAQWEVYKLALKQFYGKEYFFTRTDDYFGICTEDESDYLLKVDRELANINQPALNIGIDVDELVEATAQRARKVIEKITCHEAEGIKEAMWKMREMQRIAKEYKSNIPDQSVTSAMGLVLGRAAEIGKITL